MLLRSSSTPILGSLLSSFPDSPNRDFDNNKHPSSFDHHPKKISFPHSGLHHPGFGSFSCNSPPNSHSVVGFTDIDRESSGSGSRGFRRAQSDGNLEGLAAASCDVDEFQCSNPPTVSSRRPSMPMLETIQSFSFYNSRAKKEEDEEQDQEGGLLQRSVTIGESIDALGNADISSKKNKNMGLIMEEELNSGLEGETEPASPPLYLARGLGTDAGGLGGGGGCGSSGVPVDFGESGPDGSNVEEHYKKMVEENPTNSLFLRNYAQFLYQSKRDLQGAEEYYSRAILVDPIDGEILSQYAKLVWGLYRDHERTSSYFERAVQAAPHDSHVHAAYASFLWEIEEDEEEHSLPQHPTGVPLFHGGAMASASA
ncbi:PREDICTED: uncharacterized protein LOC104600973 [Nelumbo nucifera]|uniref:Uncharacterized protein LOC104600973 n=2 Tax=Nelumbo nucifera TaxID=4432 RepID=A0A1U8AAZ0_NELNU|nr:PREDICTED: uncharacterized protein LOC104600973 [Nelumbo nucifera]DAD36881.1 TPA_asm: hypothetical protein HUJ06_007522 [Nelumbo nucifera]